MTANPFIDRPIELLDECKEKYGLDRLTKVTENVRCYWRSFHREGMTAMAKWHTGGVDKHPAKAMAQTFMDIVEMLKEADGVKFGTETPLVDAIVLVVPGMGEVKVFHPDGRSWEHLTEDEKKLAKEAFTEVDNDDEFAGFIDNSQLDTPMPTRMIAAITLEGLVHEVTVHPPIGEPQTHRTEEWGQDGEGTNPTPRSPIDKALLAMMTLLTLIANSVAEGNGTEMSGLLKTASRIPKEDGGNAVMAELLRFMAVGFASGELDTDDVDLSGSDDDN